MRPPSRRRSVRWALATGAGKDATLALHRARAEGLDVAVGFNLYDGETDRVAFHGTPIRLVRAHCEALGLEPVLAPTEPGRFEAAFEGMLERLGGMGVGGVVFGNIHLEDVRAWYEERTTGAGLLHREPLWGGAPDRLVREVLELGYRALVVSVDLDRGDPGWVGRPLDADLVDEMAARGVDPCGEHGEFHTFVYDGPEFRRPVPVATGEMVEMHGHRLVDLSPAPAEGG